jgi:UDP-N-acetyl-D-mannosaminuronic acid dehydrogenase
MKYLLDSYMPTHMAKLVEPALEEVGKNLKESRIAVLGIAYFKDSDDTRNTPAEQFIRDLEVNGAEVVAHDPHLREFPEAELTKDFDMVLRGSDCMAIMKKNRPYFDLDLNWGREIMRSPIVVDGRNVIDTDTAPKAGFTYKGIGKRVHINSSFLKYFE